MYNSVGSFIAALLVRYLVPPNRHALRVISGKRSRSALDQLSFDGVISCIFDAEPHLRASRNKFRDTPCKWERFLHCFEGKRVALEVAHASYWKRTRVSKSFSLGGDMYVFNPSCDSRRGRGFSSPCLSMKLEQPQGKMKKTSKLSFFWHWPLQVIASTNLYTRLANLFSSDRGSTADWCLIP